MNFQPLDNPLRSQVAQLREKMVQLVDHFPRSALMMSTAALPLTNAMAAAPLADSPFALRQSLAGALINTRALLVEALEAKPSPITDTLDALVIEVTELIGRCQRPDSTCRRASHLRLVPPLQD